MPYKNYDDALANYARNAARSNAARRERRKDNPKKYRKYESASRRRNARVYLLRQAKARAAKSGIEWGLGEPREAALRLRWPTHCPVFGFELVYGASGRLRNSASLDRIDSTEGYIWGNVRVVSWRANDLKKDATPDELILLGNDADKRRRKWVESTPALDELLSRHLRSSPQGMLL